MDSQNLAVTIYEKCKVYYKKEIISEDPLLQKYVEFLTNSYFRDERRNLFSLHTGSLCFDAIAVLFTVLSCIAREIETEEDRTIEYAIDDLVVYENQRYRWKGLALNPFGEECCKLEQDSKGKNGGLTRYVHISSRNRIRPYYGNSKKTNGAGLRKKKSYREDFLSFMFNIPLSDVPTIINESVVLVCDREYFADILKNIHITYGSHEIELNEFCPATYYTSTEEEYQIGSNRLKVEPIIRVTQDLSTARSLLLNKEYRANEMVILGADVRTLGNVELEDMLHRRSIKHIHFSGILSDDLARYALDRVENSALFACTKEYLNRIGYEPETIDDESITINAKPVIYMNDSRTYLIQQLHQQAHIISTQERRDVIIENGWDWDEYLRIRKDLDTIRAATWDEDMKTQFVRTAYSLINLLNTALFTMQRMEEEIQRNALHTGVESPRDRIETLKRISDNRIPCKELCDDLIHRIEIRYEEHYNSRPKFAAVKEALLKEDYDAHIAIIINKAYYADILRPYFKGFRYRGVELITPGRFDPANYYDAIYLTGNIRFKKEDPFTCQTAAKIISFMYDNEYVPMHYKSNQHVSLIDRVHESLGIQDLTPKTEFDKTIIDTREVIEKLEAADAAIDAMSAFGYLNMNSNVSYGGYNQSTLEVTVVGTFLSGQSILFSPNYKAVVYDPASESIIEKDPKTIVPGDTLVFMLRDSYTKNTVDIIYEQLLTSGILESQIVDADKDASRWKDVLREYKISNNLTNKQLGLELRKLGSSIHEMSVAQWIAEDSHVVGPRDIESLTYIARLTGDEYLLANYSKCYEACRTIRKVRKRILQVMAEAITDKLKGKIPSKDSLLVAIWDNVDKLSTTLEIDEIIILDEPKCVPVGYVNKPID